MNADNEDSECHLVCWTGEPFTAQEPEIVEGCSDECEKGEPLCEGVHWNRQSGTARWHTAPTVIASDDKRLFRLKHVVKPSVQTKSQQEGAVLPQGPAKLMKRRASVSQAREVTMESQEATQEEIAKRAPLDHCEIEDKMESDSGSESEEEEEGENDAVEAQQDTHSH